MPIAVQQQPLTPPIMTSAPYTTSLTDPTPNPFNPTTVLNYSLAKPAQVKLMIYNILGQQVATLVDANQAAGKYRKTFDASPTLRGQRHLPGTDDHN